MALGVMLSLKGAVLPTLKFGEAFEGSTERSKRLRRRPRLSLANFTPNQRRSALELFGSRTGHRSI